MKPLIRILLLLLVSSSAQSHTDWEFCAPMPTARMDAASAVIGDTLYVMGGRGRGVGGVIDVVEAYVIVHDVWIRGLPALPDSAAAQACAVLGRRIYLFGGVGAAGELLDDIWHWSPGEPQWSGTSIHTPMPVQGACAVAPGDGGILLLGGLLESDHYGSDVFQFSPGVGFQTGPSLQQARGGAGVAVDEGEVFIVGGFFHGPLASTEILEHNHWRYGPELPGAQGGHLVSACGGDIFVVGGQGTGQDNSGILDDVLMLKKGASVWIPLREMNTPRMRLAGGVVGEFLVAAGGMSAADADPLESAERIRIDAVSLTEHPPPLPQISIRLSPNPFSQRCAIHVEFGQRSSWELSVHSISGQEIWGCRGFDQQLLTEFAPPESMPSGLYVLRVKAAGTRNAVPLILIK